jgi:hypothetical protein
MLKRTLTTLMCVLLLAGNGVVLGQLRTTDRLTGTYRLDPVRSDDVMASIDRATADLPFNQQDRVRDNLMRRLESPEMLAIQRRGQSVTIASTLAPRLSLTADGRVQTERNGLATVRASLYGDQLAIDTENNRNRDYSVTFQPVGSSLRVTRTITIPRLTDPIVITSMYNKTSSTANLNLANASAVASREPVYNGRAYVPSGTQVVAVLNTELDTSTTKDGDRFTMTVRSPATYQGAFIEGFVSDIDRAGPFSGRADLKFNFERIRLRNGRVYDFTADIEGVRTPDGDDVRIDEGRIEEEDSQTEQTVTRTGVGAALGAIIGAIAGGGKGAAIGAAVGAGAGAGSVFITGRDDLELVPGTELTLRAVTPRQS